VNNLNNLPNNLGAKNATQDNLNNLNDCAPTNYLGSLLGKMLS
jgi:hypothetical protein